MKRESLAYSGLTTNSLNFKVSDLPTLDFLTSDLPTLIKWGKESIAYSGLAADSLYFQLLAYDGLATDSLKVCWLTLCSKTNLTVTVQV